MFFAGLGLFFMNYSSGPASVNGNGYTGAPSESFTCGGCHNGGAYGTPNVSTVVSSSGTPVTSYIPGTTYDVSVTVTPGMGTPAAYGFQMVALNSANNSSGAFLDPSSNMNFVVGNSGRTYAEHNMRSISNTFSMKWTAPALNTGTVTFYSVGNTVNSAEGSGGDNGSNNAVTVILPEAVLPVELVDFTVKKKEKSAVLEWITAAEINNDYFAIEHSIDAEKFQPIELIKGMGTSSDRNTYRFTHDDLIAGNNFYRLKQVDMDGQFSYSKTVLLKNATQEIAVFPNPVQNRLFLQFEGDARPESILIFDIQGKKVMEIVEAFQEIEIDELSKGWYQLIAKTEDGLVIRKSFIKQN